MLRLALVSLLEVAGYSILEAGDGISGLKEIEKKTIDLVLLDVDLPRMSGLDVLAAIQKRKSPPKVVVMTAMATFKFEKRRACVPAASGC